MSDLAMPAQVHEESSQLPVITDELIDELIDKLIDKLIKLVIEDKKVVGEHSWSQVTDTTTNTITKADKLPANIENVLTVLLNSKLLKFFFTPQELELLTEIKDCMKNPNTSLGYDLNDQITLEISRIQGINAEHFKKKSLEFIQYYKGKVASKLATELENLNHHDVVMNIISSFLSIIGIYAEH